jgi:hypothetical protein
VTAIRKGYRAIGEKVFERFKKTKWHVLWYYRSLAREFLRVEDNELNREFARTVAELESLVEADSSQEELAVREKVYKELDNEVARSQ